MKAYILCAGLGERLRPLTETLPKPLVPIQDVPVIFFPLAVCASAGIREIGINLHYQGDKIVRLLGDGSSLGFSIRYFHEPTLLGTGGALVNAREFLQDAPFLLCNGDTIIDVPFDTLRGSPDQNHFLANLLLAKNASVAQYGGLIYQAAGILQGLVKRGETPSPKDQVAVYTGVSWIQPQLLDWLARGGEKPCVLRQGILAAQENGVVSHVLLTANYFCDTGTPEQYQQANQDVRDAIVPSKLWDAANNLFEKALLSK